MRGKIAGIVNKVVKNLLNNQNSVILCSNDHTWGLFTWRWGTPDRWGNPLRWANPPVHINVRWGNPPHGTSPTWGTMPSCKQTLNEITKRRKEVLVTSHWNFQRFLPEQILQHLCTLLGHFACYWETAQTVLKKWRDTATSVNPNTLAFRAWMFKAGLRWARVKISQG